MLPKILCRGLAGAALLGAAAALSACAPTAPDTATPAIPAMRWDHRPEAARWTVAAITAVQSRGLNLVDTVPSDIASWCPGYAKADSTGRAAFWSGLFSSIAKYESTWNPKALGGGGIYYGLLQILPSTARSVGCDPKQLFTGAVNLNCAVRIANRRVPVSDGTVASITADWGPMHWSDKRAEMAAWTRQQGYCAPTPQRVVLTAAALKAAGVPVAPAGTAAAVTGAGVAKTD